MTTVPIGLPDVSPGYMKAVEGLHDFANLADEAQSRAILIPTQAIQVSLADHLIMVCGSRTTLWMKFHTVKIQGVFTAVE